MRYLIVGLLGFVLVGCSSNSETAANANVPDSSIGDASTDESLVDAAPDSPTAGEGCSSLGLVPKAFEQVTESTLLFAKAADFQVETRGGTLQFSKLWPSCDNFLIIQDTPKQNQGFETPSLWSRDVETLFAKLPKNTQVFFVSNQSDQAQANAAIDLISSKVNTALEAAGEDQRNYWQNRVHFVTERSSEIQGWVGTLLKSPGWGIGIDRDQRIRFIGSYADSTRYDDAKKWFAPNLSMVANEAIYYNFEALRSERLAKENATVIDLFKGEKLEDPGWAGTMGYAEVELPSITDLAAYDSSELELHLGCVGEGEYGKCPAWDYLVYLYLCDELNPDKCETELGRWITTYHREGRWVHDISALLPLLSKGGKRRFAFYTQQSYEVELSIRLFNRSQPIRATSTTLLFTGGVFDPTYNDKYKPLTVAIPADAKKVEIATVITGHGGASPGNCGEFCKTTHSFTVNGQKNTRTFSDAGSSQGCMKQVSEGTVPNQYGTWWYGRSGWCPGREVPIVSIDITSQVKLGEDNLFEYQGLYQGKPYPSSGAEIRMNSWLVISTEHK